MTDFVSDWSWLFDLIKTISVVGAAVLSIREWVVKPVRQINERQIMQDKILNFIVSDRLASAHDYWMRKGYCPINDRARLQDMYTEYKTRGQNHLCKTFMDDINNLPFQ